MQIAPVPAMHTKPLVFCAVALATLTRAMGATGMVDPTLISAAAENAVRTQAGAAANLLTLQAAPLDPRLRQANVVAGASHQGALPVHHRPGLAAVFGAPDR